MGVVVFFVGLVVHVVVVSEADVVVGVLLVVPVEVRC